MNIEIKKLCEKYNEKKSFQKYNSDISIVMEFDEKQFDFGSGKSRHNDFGFLSFKI